MLSGTYQYNIDAKGRLNFPAKLRENLSETFIITTSLADPCLVVYSKEEWQRLEERLGNLPSTQTRKIKRFIFGNSTEVVPDKQGRIIVPQNLMVHGGLVKEVTIVGVSDSCEIWDSEKYLAQQEEMSQEELLQAAIALGL